LADVVSPSKRSEMMSGIKGKNTKPELILRRGLFRRGFRFRVHVSRLPGKPDIVLPKYKAVVLANGCLWHEHKCSLFKWPSTRPEFWRTKIESNKRHDAKSLEALKAQGWRVIVVWECSMKGKGRWPVDELLDSVAGWIRGGDVYSEIGERHAG
jgi:DNA mismatch endonuclease, patch repair protein